MRKLYSELVGRPVIETLSNRIIDVIKDIIVDPENGSCLAFLVSRGRIIVPYDVLHIHEAVFIEHREVIIGQEEVIRVQEVIKRDIYIMGARVVAQREKKDIGKVVDYEIDIKIMKLAALHTARRFFIFQVDERIIPASHILKIEKGKIIIKESSKRIFDKTLEAESSPAPA